MDEIRREKMACAQRGGNFPSAQDAWNDVLPGEEGVSYCSD